MVQQKYYKHRFFWIVLSIATVSVAKYTDTDREIYSYHLHKSLYNYDADGMGDMVSISMREYYLLSISIWVLNLFKI